MFYAVRVDVCLLNQKLVHFCITIAFVQWGGEYHLTTEGSELETIHFNKPFFVVFYKTMAL
uniref:Uncharacterized protein n=1 Tax=Anguilla anguilla TaxID=7936 RepID=A0A0E9XRL2_ANGAN